MGKVASLLVTLLLIVVIANHFIIPMIWMPFETITNASYVPLGLAADGSDNPAYMQHTAALEWLAPLTVVFPIGAFMIIWNYAAHQKQKKEREYHENKYNVPAGRN